MILKHYACCSDKRLIEQLNSNIDYQFYCDIHIVHHRLTCYIIVSQIRCELADKLKIDRVEKIHTQQQLLFTTGEKPKNRIVSIDKDYLRPMVLGKEIKSV